MEWLCHFCYCKCNCLAVIHVMTVETSFPKGDIHVRSFLALSRRRPLLYRNQGIDLQSKSMDWFLYDTGLRLERVNIIFVVFGYFYLSSHLPLDLFSSLQSRNLTMSRTCQGITNIYISPYLV